MTEFLDGAFFLGVFLGVFLGAFLGLRTLLESLSGYKSEADRGQNHD